MYTELGYRIQNIPSSHAARQSYIVTSRNGCFVDQDIHQSRIPRAKVFPEVFLSPSPPSEKRLVLSPPSFHQTRFLQPGPQVLRQPGPGFNNFLPSPHQFPHRLSPHPPPFISSPPLTPLTSSSLLNTFQPVSPPPAPLSLSLPPFPSRPNLLSHTQGLWPILFSS